MQPRHCDLAKKQCVPCRGGVSPLKGAVLREFQAQVTAEWRAVRGHHLEKEFIFENFVAALAFTNRVGRLAEKQGHHPDIYLAWGKVRVNIWTHKINGLTESDFILAAKIDRLKH